MYYVFRRGDSPQANPKDVQVSTALRTRMPDVSLLPASRQVCINMKFSADYLMYYVSLK